MKTLSNTETFNIIESHTPGGAWTDTEIQLLREAYSVTPVGTIKADSSI